MPRWVTDIPVNFQLIHFAFLTFLFFISCRLNDWNMIFERRYWCRIWKTFWIGQHLIRLHCESYWTACVRCVRIQRVQWAPLKPYYISFDPPIKVTPWNKCLEWVTRMKSAITKKNRTKEKRSKEIQNGKWIVVAIRLAFVP